MGKRADRREEGGAKTKTTSEDGAEKPSRKLSVGKKRSKSHKESSYKRRAKTKDRGLSSSSSKVASVAATPTSVKSGAETSPGMSSFERLLAAHRALALPAPEAALQTGRTPLRRAQARYSNQLKLMYMLPKCGRMPRPLVVEVAKVDGQEVFRLYAWAQFTATFNLPFLQYVPAPDRSKPYPPSNTPDSERYKYCKYNLLTATASNKVWMGFTVSIIMLFSQTFVIAQKNLLKYCSGQGDVVVDEWEMPQIDDDMKHHVVESIRNAQEDESGFDTYINLRLQLYTYAVLSETTREAALVYFDEARNAIEKYYSELKVDDYATTLANSSTLLPAPAPRGFSFLSYHTNPPTRMLTRRFGEH